eukprot:1462120-Rhodomonas_salina.3
MALEPALEPWGTSRVSHTTDDISSILLAASEKHDGCVSLSKTAPARSLQLKEARRSGGRPGQKKRAAGRERPRSAPSKPSPSLSLSPSKPHLSSSAHSTSPSSRNRTLRSPQASSSVAAATPRAHPHPQHQQQESEHEHEAQRREYRPPSSSRSAPHRSSPLLLSRSLRPRTAPSHRVHTAPRHVTSFRDTPALSSSPTSRASTLLRSRPHSSSSPALPVSLSLSRIGEARSILEQPLPYRDALRPPVASADK